MTFKDLGLGKFETGYVMPLLSLYMGSASYCFTADAVVLLVDCTANRRFTHE